MDKRMSENIRVKNQIAKAFFKLLEQSSSENTDNISISQITTTAHVSRMAYYRNFNSKQEIVDYYLSETLLKELLIRLNSDFEFWSMEYGLNFFIIMKNNKDLLLLLEKHGYSNSILSAFNKANENIAGDMPRNSVERFKIYFAAGASYNAVMYWLKDGCKESPQIMAESFAQFCNYLNYPPL